MKGIILAGGRSSRLFPATYALSKQLLPIYDKPLIYYPISVLMLAGLRDIMIITRPDEQALFERLLGDGRQWGIAISYATQNHPNGIAEAFIIARDFLAGDSAALALGDNIFFGNGLSGLLQAMVRRSAGASVLAYWVVAPERYGVVHFDENGRALDIAEKPPSPRSNWALTGFYVFDGRVSEIAGNLRPSGRGELEITDVAKWYLARGELNVDRLGRGFAWFDTGTHDSLLQAASFVETIEARQGMKIGSPEETAWRMGFIDTTQLQRLAKQLEKSGYGAYLRWISEQRV